jgi:hypothetical protein
MAKYPLFGLYIKNYKTIRILAMKPAMRARVNAVADTRRRPFRCRHPDKADDTAGAERRTQDDYN